MYVCVCSQIWTILQFSLDITLEPIKINTTHDILVKDWRKFTILFWTIYYRRTNPNIGNLKNEQPDNLEVWLCTIFGSGNRDQKNCCTTRYYISKLKKINIPRLWFISYAKYVRRTDVTATSQIRFWNIQNTYIFLLMNFLITIIL